MTIHDLFALREQMQEVLSAKLKAKKVELECRLQALNQQSKLIETMKPGLQGLLLTFGHCGCVWSFCRSYQIFELLDFRPSVRRSAVVRTEILLVENSNCPVPC